MGDDDGHHLEHQWHHGLRRTLVIICNQVLCGLFLEYATVVSRASGGDVGISVTTGPQPKKGAPADMERRLGEQRAGV